MRKIAVTGGLSSGKTSVCEIFKRLGAYVADADAIVHQLLSPNTPIGKAIIEIFGEDVVEQGQLSREKIGQKAFQDAKSLRALEKILHPAVLEEIEKQYAQTSQQRYSLFVAEIPLLYETDSQHLFDATIAVSCDPQVASNRFQERATQSEEEFERRMNHQLPPSEKEAKADYVIQNNKDLSSLESQVKHLYNKLTQE